MRKSLQLELNGQRVSRETSERLERFAAHFNKWAKAINLVAASTTGDLWDRHIADSAQLYQLQPEARIWMDLGSGGGFPGLITAIMLAETGAGWVHLVESNQKKASFLRSAILETGARASVHVRRIEDVAQDIPECDAISSRALADLVQLLHLSAPWMVGRPSTRAFFHKGRDYSREVSRAHGDWDFDLVKHPSRVDPESVILEISNLAPRR